jgi:hypothetical protein
MKKDVEKIDSPATIKFKAKQKAEAAKRLEVQKRREKRVMKKIIYDTRKAAEEVLSKKDINVMEACVVDAVTKDEHEGCRPPND